MPSSAAIVPATPTSTINVKDFGAKGDGQTDDTVPLVAAITYLNSLGDQPATLVFPQGRYFINPLKGMRPHYGLYITASNVTIEGDNASLELLPGAKYSTQYPVPRNTTMYWNYFGVRGSNVTLHNMEFNSNDMVSVGPYSDDDHFGKFWATAIHFSSDTDQPQQHNSAIHNRFVNIGGWAVIAEHQTNITISSNYASQSEGIGCAGWIDGCLISGNVSENALDAHYFANGSTTAGSEARNVTIVGNTATGNQNGSGIDITAASDTIVEGNTVSGNANWCILVGKSNGPYNQPATWLPSQRITVAGNTCQGNGTYQGWPMNAEILVGEERSGNSSRQYLPGDIAADITVTDNQISSLNAQGRGITVGYGVTNTTITANHMSGCGDAHSNPCGFPLRPIVRIEDWGSAYLTITANDQDSQFPVGYIYLGNGGPYNVSGNDLTVGSRSQN